MASVSSEQCDSDVVLTGLSARLPECGSLDEFARQLFAGADLVTADERRWTPGWNGLPKRQGKLEDLAHFDAEFFGVHAKQAHAMDPQLRLLLEVTHETIVDAGFSPAELRGSRTAVYVGTANSDTWELLSMDQERNDGYGLIGCNKAMSANQISYMFDFKGPSVPIDTACSSSMFALVQGMNAIRNGDCEAAVVAGTHICLKPHTSLNYQRLKMLSADGRCAAFDASAGGFVRSEAVVAVLLQRRRAARRVYCTVRGARVNTDGYKPQGILHPSGAMQSRVARETLAEARLRPQDVVYVEAHGTGTKVGDPVEVNAIAEVYCEGRQSPLLLGSVKSNMGHAEPAAGLCSLAKVVLAMERGLIPANLHFRNPNKDIPALSDGRIKVVDKNTPWQGGLVALNSFGFGGTNAHVIVEGGRGARSPPAAYPAPRLVLASGRTDAAVERLLRLAAAHPRDAELHALIDAVFARATPRHPRRGYTLLEPGRDAPLMLEVLESAEEPRPLWFVFSGMGTQWPGVARSLLRLPAFAASIVRSASALEPHGVDLRYLLTEAPDADCHEVINAAVSITAIQVALVDVLRELGLHPDGMVGLSLGEIGCAYADEALTGEQAVLCAYWRGRSIVDARLAPGAMAGLGLSWEQAARRCPADVVLACDYSPNRVAVSGPPASIDKLIAELSAEGVVAKRGNSSGVAFHSKYIAAAAPLLLANLQQVIPEPKKRSVRWLSTSVRQDQGNSDLDSAEASTCDAAYFVNNLLSPVWFTGALARLPARALLLELAPHAVLQGLLRRERPRAALVPLLRRDAPDSLSHMLAAVGRTYAAGAQPQVSRLYERVPWPVSRGTPSLASHVGWEHSAEWRVADARAEHAEHAVEVDLRRPEDAFIAGHDLDGRVLFPAAGYLILVWRTIAKVNNLVMDEATVVLENVEFCRATIVPRDAPLRFVVSLPGGSGEFRVSESGAVVATGAARLAAERLPAAAPDVPEDAQEDSGSLSSNDIYKLFQPCGLHYKGVFRGIMSSDARSTRGTIAWMDNWISFIDTMMQFSFLGRDKHALFVPTRLQRVLIDPAAQRDAVAAAATSGGAVPIKSCHSVNIVQAGGVELRGVKFTPVPRRVDAQALPKLEKHVFVPLDSACAHTAQARHAFAAALLLARDNCGAPELRLLEPALGRPAPALLLPRALQVLAAEPAAHAFATLAAGADAAHYAAHLHSLPIEVTDKDVAGGGLGSDWHVVLGDGVLARGCELRALAAACAGFVLLREPPRALDDPAARARVADADLHLVSRAPAAECEYVLLRRSAPSPTTKIAVEVRDDDYTWVEPLKLAVQRAETQDVRVYAWSRAPGCGVLGLGACLRREPGGDRLRVYHLPGAPDAFDPDAPAYRTQVQRDLAFNVLRDGVWGTYRHFPLDDTADTRLEQVEHAYVNSLTRGDLSSLRWVASELPRAASGRVYCAPLNFRDVMLASGKLAPDALPGDLAEQECILGLEFSGRSSTGKRVMGMVSAKGLATSVLADETFTWEVPQHWSLEEAATVPVAYATAYYALAVRGRMRRGEAVLVHAGAGGVGQAAIAIALHAGCSVFTTVGSPDKRAFLLERFPQLADGDIGNSRDCSFEHLVLRRTRGRGVDLVLNSLAGDQLQASLRCLGKGGRFLEIGKVDLAANTALGMGVLLKNTTVHGILLDALFDACGDDPEKAEVVKCVVEGIAAGAVRPLPATVYNNNQLEEAFRYMASSKHIGKVVIRVREEEAPGDPAPAPARLPRVVPRTYMHPDKSYLLVGGLGGFGLELGGWLVARGARALVLSSRSGVRDGLQAWHIRRWRASGARVEVSRADAAEPAGARALLRAAAALAPVGGVFHLAAVLHDALLQNLTAEHFRAVAAPKVDALRALDAASRELAPQLEHFVAFSSVASGRGHEGQSNYGLANSGMERLCERRRAAGLPALAVQWGAVADVGMLAADARDAVGGTKPQRIASCLEMLDALLPQPHAVVACMVVADKRRAQLESTPDLLHTIANILGIKKPGAVPATATLAELGMDSLMSAEVKLALERGGVLLSTRDTRALTLRDLRRLAGGAAAPPPDPPACASNNHNSK